MIQQDRGLGAAYERWCFYRLLGKWAAEYGVTSALEGPLDGMVGVRGVHCVGLARAGVRVITLVGDEPSADLARAIYTDAAPGQRAEVRVAKTTIDDKLPASDLVLVYQGLRLAEDWRSYVHAMAKLASKVFVVVTHNPDNWAVVARDLFRGAPEPDVSRTETLAPVLWELGRVREHVYFDAPWLPAWAPAPGWVPGLRASAKHVYGAGRWPYFGGTGWADELEPALVGRRSFEQSRPIVLRRAARLHAFVVDVRPRTPQARRRLSVTRVGA